MPNDLLSTQEILNRIFDRSTNKLNISGGAGSFDATVGPDETYTTIKDAIDAGNSRLLIKGSTTETANINIVAATMPNVYIYIEPGVIVDMGAFRFTDTGSTISFVVESDSLGSLGYILYAHTVSGQELFDLDSNCYLGLSNLFIENNSTAGNCTVSTCIEIIENVIIDLPDQSQCGFEGSPGSIYSNLELIGGGNSCDFGLVAFDASINNLYVSGTWVSTSFTSSSTNSALDLSSVNINGIVFSHATNPIKVIFSDSNVVNVRSESTVATHLIFPQRICNVYATSGAINVMCADASLFFGGNVAAGTVDTNSADNCVIDGVISTGLLDLTDTASHNNKISNSRFSSALTVAGDRNSFVNTQILGGVSVSSGADNNGFMNCQAGADAGGGALTITIVAGSNNTRVVGCMTDAAISDSGTGTVLSANVVY